MPIPFQAVNQLWNQLQWNVVVPELTPFRQHPVRFPHALEVPGLYRVSILSSEFWNENALQRLEVDAARQIRDAQDAFLQPRDWTVPFVVTVGCSTNIKSRLQQHLGANEKNNRLLSGLRRLFPNLTDDALRHVCTNHMKFEITQVADWRIRFLLERYGAAIEQPLLDFKAES